MYHVIKNNIHLVFTKLVYYFEIFFLFLVAQGSWFSQDRLFS